MKRSPWKYLPLVENDFRYYFYLKIYKRSFRQYKSFARAQVINKFNFFYKRQIHQGSVYVDYLPSSYSVGFKNSQFTKTRKPFFFRSKKKR